MGNALADVLFTLPKLTIAAVKPFTVEENVTGPEKLIVDVHVVARVQTVGNRMLNWVFEYVNA